MKEKRRFGSISFIIRSAPTSPQPNNSHQSLTPTLKVHTKRSAQLRGSGVPESERPISIPRSPLFFPIIQKVEKADFMISDDFAIWNQFVTLTYPSPCEIGWISLKFSGNMCCETNISWWKFQWNWPNLTEAWMIEKDDVAIQRGVGLQNSWWFLFQKKLSLQVKYEIV